MKKCQDAVRTHPRCWEAVGCDVLEQRGCIRQGHDTSYSVRYKVLRRVAICWKTSGHDTLGQHLSLLSVGMGLKWLGSVKSQRFGAGEMSSRNVLGRATCRNI